MKGMMLKGEGSTWNWVDVMGIEWKVMGIGWKTWNMCDVVWMANLV